MYYHEIPLHDVHVHTHLSLCSNDQEATVENYAVKAREIGLELLGISDHMWDTRRVPLKNFPFYEEMDFERQLGNRDTYFQQAGQIPLLIGAETEYAQGVLGVTADTKSQLDYLLIPHSHLHMKGFVLPPEEDTPERIAKYMLKTFCEVAETGLATGIPHPFDPCFMYENLEEIFSYLSDAAFMECFAYAARRRISIEINFSCFDLQQDSPRNHCYFRMLRLAKKAGCQFHFGSDAHHLSELYWSSLDNAAWAIEQIGLKKSDIADFVLYNCRSS